jgi:hypothetical protein
MKQAKEAVSVQRKTVQTSADKIDSLYSINNQWVVTM